MFANEITARSVGFLKEIGIVVRAATLQADTFLPGIAVVDGEMLVDEARLLYPGDLLHEAGHLALMTPADRKHASDAVEHENSQVLEVATIAWSYAAALHLGIDPALVLHEGGYHGHSASLLRTYALGVYLGVDQLAGFGLTRIANSAGEPSYPAMIKWLRE